MKAFFLFPLIALTFTQFSAIAAEKGGVEKAEVAEAVLARAIAWKMFSAQVVANQPKNVGWERFSKAMDLKALSAPSKELGRFAKKAKTWPQVVIDGDNLVVQEAGKLPLTIGIAPEIDGGLVVNGRKFQLDAKKPIVKQLNDFLAKAQGDKTAALSFALVPEANAADLNASAPFLIGPGTAALGGYLVYTGIGLAGGTGAAVVGGVAIVAAGIPLAAMGLICGSQAQDRRVYDNPSVWRRFSGCMLSPLSMLGMNPNDTLHFRNIECRDNSMRVILKTADGRIGAERTFEFSNGRLRTISIYQDFKTVDLTLNDTGTRIESGRTDVNSRNGAGVLSRPRQGGQLDALQPLLRDFELYRSLCADPARRDELVRRIGRGLEQGERAYDGQSNDQLNRSAR